MNTAVLSERNHDTEPERATEDSGCGAPGTIARLEPGHCISNKYLIKGVLGAGGFAVVYEAEHLGLQCVMAIKVLHVDERTPNFLIARFREEARISAAIHHRNVLDVHDTGTLDDGSPYLVMERIEGETLYEAMQRGRLEIDEVIDIAHQLLTALCALHALAIVHRDIKPGNLMFHISSSGERILKLVDFGISKNLHAGLGARQTLGGLTGTPHYMAPEHLAGEEATPQSDLYAAGVVLYEALTGEVPHDGTCLSSLMWSVLHGEVRPIRSLRPDCPEALERIVVRALQRDRKARYPTPEAMLDETDALRRQRAAALAPSKITLSFGPEDDLPDLWTPTTLSLPPPPPVTRLRRRQVAGNKLLLTLSACLFFAVLKQDSGTFDAPKASLWPIAMDEPKSSDLPPVTVHMHASLPSVLASLPSEGDTPLAKPPAPAGIPVERVAPPSAPSVEAAEAPPRRQSHAARRRAAELLAAEPALEIRSVSLASATTRRQNHALVEAALAEYVRGRRQEAEALYRRATLMSPDDPLAFRGLGIVAAHLGKVSDARNALERYLELDPLAKDAELIRARLLALR